MPGVPVAEHRHGLGTPVSPDAQLRVTEPVRAPILLSDSIVGANGPEAIGSVLGGAELSAFKVPVNPSNRNGSIVIFVISVRGTGMWFMVLQLWVS